MDEKLSTRRIQLCRAKNFREYFFYFFKSPKNENMIFCTPPLNAPRRELFICIFKSAVALSVSRQIDFLCVRTGRPIQLYARAESLVEQKACLLAGCDLQTSFLLPQHPQRQTVLPVLPSRTSCGAAGATTRAWGCQSLETYIVVVRTRRQCRTNWEMRGCHADLRSPSRTTRRRPNDVQHKDLLVSVLWKRGLRGPRSRQWSGRPCKAPRRAHVCRS